MQTNSKMNQTTSMSIQLTIYPFKEILYTVSPFKETTLNESNISLIIFSNQNKQIQTRYNSKITVTNFLISYIYINQDSKFQFRNKIYSCRSRKIFWACLTWLRMIQNGPVILTYITKQLSKHFPVTVVIE